MLMHVVIDDHSLRGFLLRMKLVGQEPVVVCSRELGQAISHVVIKLARINEIAGRVIVAWLRAAPGVKSVRLDWKASAEGAPSQLQALGTEPLEAADMHSRFLPSPTNCVEANQ